MDHGNVFMFVSLIDFHSHIFVEILMTISIFNVIDQDFPISVV